jgi:hypothetical protein
MPTNLSKRIKAAETTGRRFEIEKEKEAYSLYIATLTPEEAKRFWDLWGVPIKELEVRTSTWAELALDWSTEVRFYNALYQVFGYYPKAAMDALAEVESGHKLTVKPEMTVTDRINQLVAHFKVLAEEEALEVEIEKVH